MAASIRRSPTALTQYGLDVTIRPGGPQVNKRILLPAGKSTSTWAPTAAAVRASRQNIPTVVVAAIFQKDPQVLIAHPDQGNEKFADLEEAHDASSRTEGLRDLVPVAQGGLRLQRRRR